MGRCKLSFPSPSAPCHVPPCMSPPSLSVWAPSLTVGPSLCMLLLLSGVMELWLGRGQRVGGREGVGKGSPQEGRCGSAPVLWVSYV